MGLLFTFAKLVVALILIQVYLRASSNSQLSPMSASDQVGNIVIGALAGGTIVTDVSLPVMAAVITMWAGLLILVRALKYRSARFSDLLDGKRMQLVDEGELLIGNFEKTKITPDDFMMTLHQDGINSLDEVSNVWYEPSGEFTFDKEDDERLSKVIISNGAVVKHSLEFLHKDEAWLDAQLAEEGDFSVSDIFLAEYHDDKLWVYPFPKKEGKV